MILKFIRLYNWTPNDSSGVEDTHNDLLLSLSLPNFKVKCIHDSHFTNTNEILVFAQHAAARGAHIFECLPSYEITTGSVYTIMR